MYQLLSFLMLFAQDAPPAAPDAPHPNALMQMLPFLAIGGLFIWLIIIRPQKQEQARQKALLDGIKKNDHVVTTGGIFGVVTNVHREANKVTIRVDEATNTTLRIAISSIAGVVSEEAPQGTESK